MSVTEADELYTRGMDALKEGNIAAARELLEKAVSQSRTPRYCSSLGLCLVRGKGDYKRAVSLCNEAIKNEPKNSFHFLNLGRVHLAAGRKRDAIRIFNMGLRHQNNVEIVAELNRLGTRKPPVIPFLARDNPVNKFLGKLLSKWGYR